MIQAYEAGVPENGQPFPDGSRIADRHMSNMVRWIRSYVLDEADGTLGTSCIYQAINPEAIRMHARRAGMPADEITPVAATVIVREDPQEVSEAA